MSFRKALFVICLMILVVCLAVGYWIAGKWIGAVLAILLGPVWLFAQKTTDPWLLFICLLASVGLAVAGRLAGVIPLLTILCSAFSLAVWDLIFLDATLRKNSFGALTRRFEYKHVQSLGLALGFSLFGVLLGRLINLRIPFMVLLILIAFTVFAMDRAWGYIKRTKKWRPER